MLRELLTVEDVRARYQLRDPRSARRIIRQVGGLTVAGRLYVRQDALELWEARQAAAPATVPTRSARRRRQPVAAGAHDLSDLPDEWWQP
jgi:hypothetical protein